MEIEELGYNIETHGQKTFNGVAILSKRPFEVARGLPGDENDFAVALYRGGRPGRRRRGAGGERLSAERQSGRHPRNTPISSPSWSGSSSTPASSSNTRSRWCWPAISTSFPTRATPRVRRIGSTTRCFCRRRGSKFRELIALGLTDALRATTDAAGLYTFWDYQAGAWQKNNGIRIDHLLLSPEAADRLQSVAIDKEMRGRDKASDHTPVRIDLAA